MSFFFTLFFDTSANYGSCTATIHTHHRVVITIRKHIVTDNTCAGRYETVGVDESAECGIIVSTLQIVEACFTIVNVSAVAEGIQQRHMGSIGYLTTVQIGYG